MIPTKSFAPIIKNIAAGFYPVVPFDPQTEKIALLDLSPANKSFSKANYETTEALHQFIDNTRQSAGAKFLIGGYKETRNMYRRSDLFDKNLAADEVADEPRNFHLGIDIWGETDTSISAPLGGMVHSYAFNDNFGDYGATIILQHQVDTLNFYTLYGHLAVKDLSAIRSGQFITRGETFAHFGPPEENGHWPPHLHFQVILDMGNMEGDYPGVCKTSEWEKYVANSPDPDSMLNIMRFVSQT